jgi:hypothetical protein
MSRLFGYVVGAVWLFFSFWAFRTSAAGWAQEHADIGFWWAVIGTFFGIAAMVALVGTTRYRYQGPQK